MTDIINDEDVKKAVTKIFTLFGNKILNSKDFVQKQITDAQNIINKNKIEEKDLSNLIEIFNLVIEFPRGRINKEMEIKDFLDANTPKEMVEALEMEIAFQKVEKDSDKQTMKDSIIKATNIKKKILNYLFNNKKNIKQENSKILYHVNNINRHEINKDMNLSEIKKKMRENDIWRIEIINILSMKKDERDNNNTRYQDIIKLLAMEKTREEEKDEEEKDEEKLVSIQQIKGRIQNARDLVINFKSFNIIKGSSGIVGNSSVPVPVPVPVPVSGKSIFTEKKNVSKLQNMATNFVLHLLTKNAIQKLMIKWVAEKESQKEEEKKVGNI